VWEDILINLDEATLRGFDRGIMTVVVHRFDDWFPMKDYPDQGVTGAHTWLTYRVSKNIIHAIRNNPNMPAKNFRRLALVGLIYEQGLVDDFLQACWTQGKKNTTERRKRMDQFYRWFKNRPKLVQWLNGQLYVTRLPQPGP